MSKHRIYTMSVASVYPHYVNKAERKGRSKEEVDEIIRWLTGYSQEELEEQLEKETDFETFFEEAPKMNPLRSLIKGVVCGVRVENIEESIMREIRYLDKLIDELAKGKYVLAISARRSTQSYRGNLPSSNRALTSLKTLLIALSCISFIFTVSEEDLKDSLKSLKEINSLFK